MRRIWWFAVSGIGMMIYISGMATFGVATRNMRAVSPRVCFIGLTLLSVGRISTSLAQVMSLNLPRRARLPRESFREVVPGSIEESQREAALLLREIILGRALNDEDKITGIELANFCADFERAAACVDIESCEITLSKPEGTNCELESAAIKELFEPAFSARWMTARADEDDETERISMLSNADHVRAFLLAQPVEWSATVRDLHASRPEDGPFRAEMTKISTSTVLVKIVNEAHEAQTRRELLDEIAELQLAVAERERRLAESIQQHQVDLADVTNTARAELQAAHEDAQEARGLAERELSRFRAMLRLAESKLEMATMRERIALTAGQSARRNAEEEVLAARLEQERARNEAQTARELLTRIVQEPRAHALESAGINSAAGVWEVIMSSFQPLPFSCTRARSARETKQSHVGRWAVPHEHSWIGRRAAMRTVMSPTSWRQPPPRGSASHKTHRCTTREFDLTTPSSKRAPLRSRGHTATAPLGAFSASLWATHGIASTASITWRCIFRAGAGSRGL